MSDRLTDAEVALIERKHAQDQEMIDRPNGLDAWRLDMVAHDDIGALLRDRRELEAEVARLSKGRCDDCGATLYSGPPDCLLCGAPVCCQRCCKIDHHKTSAEAAEAKLAAVRKELEYAVSASIEGNDVDVVAEDSIRDALDGLLKRTILYNDPCAGSYEVLDPPTTDELKALLREDGK